MDADLWMKLMTLGVETGIGVILLLAAFALKKWNVTRTYTQPLGTLLEMAYGYVAEKARQTPNGIDDKAVEGLKKLAELLKAQGQELTPEIELKARAAFDAMHFAEKQRAAALEAAASPH